ncbi:sigma-70 family RNA polymerase sigma factor [Nocardioides sp.]|uniref:sigma-70 family RNA polymerase sigma factor n=1 Tax=Nocardioides sp. TaxID=35761 RepID=UPI003564305A
MTISALDHSPSRSTRRRETTRLFAEATGARGPELEAIHEQIIVANLGVARAIARRYRDRSIPLEDLEQVAYVALVRATRKFDASSGRDFLTYAVPSISGELKRHFRDHGWTVRPPRRVQEIQSTVINAHRRAQEGGRPPSASRLAEELGLKEADVAEALQAQGCFAPVSLDIPVTDDGRAAIEVLADDESAEERALEARLMLGPALAKLSARDRKILHLRFVQDLTQQQIGAHLGVSQMQASRLLKRILNTLRERMGPLDGLDAASA